VTVTVRRETTFACSLERAFRAPMLGDITKVHTGLALMPRVTHCTDDAGWGAVGSSKRVFMSKTPVFAGGFASVDRVLERVENVRWTIEVSEFQPWVLGFTRFVGTWETAARARDEVHVRYTYALHGSGPLAPAQWLFGKTFWWRYMGQVLENVRALALGDAPLAG
jgi:hypothetical protein